MNRKFKILAVAPYESLKEVLLQTAKEYPQLDVTVEVGPIYEGLKKLQKYDLSQFDAVLSRGGAKMEIEKHTTLPVFKIPISYFDLLNIIKLVEHYQGKIAILTYENIANAARVLCDLLHFPYNIFIINEWHNAKEKVLQLKEQGYTLIIGDAVFVIHAERLGLQSILLTSSAASVREATDTSSMSAPMWRPSRPTPVCSTSTAGISSGPFLTSIDRENSCMGRIPLGSRPSRPSVPIRSLLWRRNNS